jgi:hypothetical protein
MLTVERPPTDPDLIADLAATHARIGRDQCQLLGLIADLEARYDWEEWGLATIRSIARAGPSVPAPAR